jgi:hypothetical protein
MKAYGGVAISFLSSAQRYSSGWALASWIISLHFSLFFICSDDEASNGRMKKWEECGWKRSWPTYFHWYILSVYIDPHSIELYTSLRWVVSFTLWQLYPQGKKPGTHWIGGWVEPRVGLDDVEKRKFLTLPGLELWPLSRPARSQSLYRLRYPGSS